MSAVIHHHNAAVSNTSFLAEVGSASPAGTFLWVANFIGDPSSGNWAGRPYGGAEHADAVADSWGKQNTYYCTAALQYTEDGEIGRRRSCFARQLSLVVDDADRSGLTAGPSYIIRTSPGKEQIGVFLDADDPDCANEALCVALVNALAKKGYIGGDKSGNNVVRYVRLPVGQNQKKRDSGHFDHELDVWAPHVRLDLENAAQVFGVNLDEVKAEMAAQPAVVPTLGKDCGVGLRALVSGVLDGTSFHDNLRDLAASVVSTGMHPGAATNLLRGVLEASSWPRDDRWNRAYKGIPHEVKTAEQKYYRPAAAMPLAANVDTLQADSAPRLIIDISEMVAKLKPIDWLIRDYLECNAMSMLFGPSNIGKSFIAIEQALCIASGKDWHGRAVKQGLVILVAGEGHSGLTRRVMAWAKENDVDLTKIPFCVTQRSVAILDASEAELLVQEIDRIVLAKNCKPVAIVIDTLARNFGPGDENSTQDANAFTQFVDHHLRLRYECHVAIVHHSGHQEGRARGSSVLKASMDQEFEAKSVGGFLVYRPTKMKDAEKPRELQFSIRGGIEVGEYAGEKIFGAKLDLIGSEIDATVVDGVTIFDVLKAVRDKWIPYDQLCTVLGVSERTAKKAVKLVADKGKWLQKEQGGRSPGWTLTEAGMTALSYTGEFLINKTEAYE